jgi:hypothetical protein
MKVYEMLNKLKGSNACIVQIRNWMRMNHIQPYELLTNEKDDEIGIAINVLELEEDLPQSLVNVIKAKPLIEENEIMTFLETELVERDAVCEGQLGLFEVGE